MSKASTVPSRSTVWKMALICGVLLSPVVYSSDLEIPDTSAARRELLALLAITPFAEPIQQDFALPGAAPASVSTEYQQGNRYLTVAPTSYGGVLANPGTYIIRQDMGSGEIDQVKVFLQAHPGAFVRVQPREGSRTTELELHLGGALISQRVPLPMTMERVVEAPFSDIVERTTGQVPWDLAAPDFQASGYREIAAVVRDIRNHLPSLPDADDGAMDADGAFVAIETLEARVEGGGLNCSGFAKWVVDGFVSGVSGSLLPVAPLREGHPDLRGTAWTRRADRWEDAYFGLDWTRNLARYAERARSESPELAGGEAFDVRNVRVARYREDVGFSMDSLRGVVYSLAVQQPGTWYLGSVNGPSADGTGRRHSHVVVVMPYFDTRGRYRPVVFERNRETDLDDLAYRYPDHHVHLVELSGAGPFVPPKLPR